MDYNRMAEEYIRNSYMYYVLGTSNVTDNMFDTSAKLLLENWDKLSDENKKLLPKDMLRCGTYLGGYPEKIIKDLV